jgi:Gas vesicle synthesis protein GvpL/GvpF
VIQLYAITDDPAPANPPLFAVPCVAGLVALCAPAHDQEVTPAALWRYEEMVEALMESRDVLPVRFGTLVADENAVVGALAKRRSELAASLDRVRGAVELAVRAREREAPSRPEVAPSGSAYLRAKASRGGVARRLHERLADHARASVVLSGSELLRAAYLVNRDDVDSFVALVDELQSDYAELDLVCTGPWPAYSFADGTS